MPIAELAALGVAALWAITGLMSLTPSRRLGAVAFNRIRMSIVLIALIGMSLLNGGWRSLDSPHFNMLVLSGVIGIFIGDTAMFACLRRLGPRRTGILFATNAPMAVLLGFIFLDEALSQRAILGCCLVSGGVILAIIYGKRRAQLHQWESVQGRLGVGIAFGLFAALCQASGSLLAKPAMQAAVDPIAASAVRVGCAVILLYLILLLPGGRFKALEKPDLRLITQAGLSSILGMGVGMTLLLYALTHGEVGIVSTLSSMTPVITLPLLWYKTRERPAAGAWAGAILAVGGVALIVGDV